MQKCITYREEEDKKKFIKRLKIMEGQIKGITQMIEEDRYCNDILIQISALDHALKNFGVEVLKRHLFTCVMQDIQDGKADIMDEVVDLIKRFYV